MLMQTASIYISATTPRKGFSAVQGGASNSKEVATEAKGKTSYLEPAKSATVNNAGVDQAGRDDAGEA
jgi:hypothetical protein